jgi:hypothetical protein
MVGHPTEAVRDGGALPEPPIERPTDATTQVGNEENEKKAPSFEYIMNGKP